MFSKAWENSGLEHLGIFHEREMEKNFYEKEEIFHGIGLAAQEMIRSNPKNELDDSAKQILDSLCAKLYRPEIHNYTIDFYHKRFHIQKYESRADKWRKGYVWLPEPFDTRTKFYKEDSTEFEIWDYGLSGGWYLYDEHQAGFARNP
jgi:hypothetical protein